jgi:hypothetical protein
MTSKTGFRRSPSLGLLPFAAVLSIAFTPSPAVSDPASLRASFANELAVQQFDAETVAEDESIKAVRTFLDNYEKLEDERTGLSGSVSFGFSGNSAGEGNSEGKGNVEVSLRAGTYPSELSVSFGADLNFAKDQLEDDVTRMLATYDRILPSGNTEVYAFVERFSDSFMSIDQRYEIGVGGLFQWPRMRGSARRQPASARTECGATAVAYRRIGTPVLEPGQAAAPETDSGPASTSETDSEETPREPGTENETPEQRENRLERWANTNGYAATTVAFEDSRREAALKWDQRVAPDRETRSYATYNSFSKALCDEDMSLAQQHLWNKNRRTRFSIAFSLFADFESPIIKSRILDSNGDPLRDPTTMQELAAEERSPTDDRRLRYTVRPRLEYKVNEVISFDGQVYVKLPVDGPKEIEVSPGRFERDMRIDGIFSMTWALGQLFPSSAGKNASIVFSYEYHEDPVPPNLSSLSAQLLPGQSFEKPIAEDIRRTAKMAVKIEF